MKNTKASRMLCLGFAVMMGMSGLTVQATSLTKNVKAFYRDIKVNYNGKVQSLQIEPFLVDNSVYVPLRAMSEMMGSEVKWDAASNTIIATSTINNNEQEIAQKNFEIANLKNQLNVAKAEIEKLKSESNNTTSNSGTSNTNYKETVSNLIKEYGDEYSVEWDFTLSEKNNNLVLTIDFDSKYDGKYFDRISPSKLEAFAKSVSEYISSKHANLNIVGEVYDSYEKDSVSEFEYTTKGKFTYENLNTATSFKDVEKSLLREFKYFDDLYSVTDKTTFDLTIQDIVLSEKRNTLTFAISVDLENPDRKADWNSLNSSSKRTVKYLMEDIVLELEDVYGTSYDYIDGFIEDSKGNMIADYDGDEIVFNSIKID